MFHNKMSLVCLVRTISLLAACSMHTSAMASEGTARVLQAYTGSQTVPPPTTCTMPQRGVSPARAAWGRGPYCSFRYCKGYYDAPTTFSLTAWGNGEDEDFCECMTHNDCYFSWQADTWTGEKSLTPVCSGASSLTNTVGRCVPGRPVPVVNFSLPVGMSPAPDAGCRSSRSCFLRTGWCFAGTALAVLIDVQIRPAAAALMRTVRAPCS